MLQRGLQLGKNGVEVRLVLLIAGGEGCGEEGFRFVQFPVLYDGVKIPLSGEPAVVAKLQLMLRLRPAFFPGEGFRLPQRLQSGIDLLPDLAGAGKRADEKQREDTCWNIECFNVSSSLGMQMMWPLSSTDRRNT